jgi:hypothetical protein
VNRRVDVERIDEDGDRERFRVRLNDHTYDVTVSATDKGELAPAAQTEALVRESFAFLLEREPLGAILPRFDLSVIQRYFPEYRTEIKRRLGM